MHGEIKEGTTNIGEGNCEEVKNAEAIEPLAREAAKFKYLTWDEFKTESNFLGVDYEASHEKLLKKASEIKAVVCRKGCIFPYS